jgi:hypothetical protein
MKTLLRQALPHSAEPEDWSGFWPGIVRGIQDRTERGGRPVPARWSYRWTRRRWALSGVAAAAVAVLSFVVGYETWPVSGPPEDPVVITAANSQYPGGAMVYSAPEKLAVVWVFDE